MNAAFSGWYLASRCYTCTFPSTGARASRYKTALACKAQFKNRQNLTKKITAFFTPFHLAFGDYLALLTYCVVDKLSYVDILSTVIMLVEKVKCFEHFSVLNCLLYLYRVAEGQTGWIGSFRHYNTFFYFNSFFEG